MVFTAVVLVVAAVVAVVSPVVVEVVVEVVCSGSWTLQNVGSSGNSRS